MAERVAAAPRSTALSDLLPGALNLLGLILTFQHPASYVNGEPAEPWTMRLDHQAGDLGFDPMGLKPTDPKELAEMQTKVLNNGRLAMIAIAGMVVQEGITGAKLF